MSAQKLRITLADGRTIDVQPTLEDRLKFESTLRKNRGWGDLKDNAIKLTPFLAWSAASRAGLVTCTWAEFTTGETAALDVETVIPDEDDDEAACDDLEVEGLGEGTPTGAFTSFPSYSDSVSE